MATKEAALKKTTAQMAKKEKLELSSAFRYCYRITNLHMRFLLFARDWAAS
jgi:hypothetical protein